MKSVALVDPQILTLFLFILLCMLQMGLQITKMYVTCALQVLLPANLGQSFIKRNKIEWQSFEFDHVTNMYFTDSSLKYLISGLWNTASQNSAGISHSVIMYCPNFVVWWCKLSSTRNKWFKNYQNFCQFLTVMLSCND